MATSTPCPGADDYQRLLRGLLPSRQVRRLTEHIEHCEACLETVRQLSADDSLQEVLPAARAADLPQGDLVEGLIRRVCRLRPARPPEHTPPPAEDTSEQYDFLAPPEGPGEIGRLGPYRVLRVLGTGGMGIVFQAEDVQLRRPVALKVMKPALAARGVDRQRFLREAQAAAAVRHDHVVTIYQVDQDRDVPFLAMELLEGETLEARLQREGRLPPAEVLRIGREVSDGLGAAHARDLIHRDIKPANIWLEGERGRVKILDFGLVRAVGDGAHLTASGAIAGTPAYMAPEQARGEVLDHRADLFSLGCVLYRAAVGEPPFRGTEPLAVLQALAVVHPRPPRKRNPAVPPPLSALIMQLLAKNRDERPATARGVVQALAALERRAAAQPTVPAPPPPVRRRRLVLPAAAVLLAAVALSGYLLWPVLTRVVPGDLFARAGPKEPDVPPIESPHNPPGPAPAPAPAPPQTPVPKPVPSQQPVQKEGSALVSARDLAARARDILTTNCHRCHGQDGAVEGGFNYVLDLRQLVARRKVRPGKPEESRLYQRLTSRDNPMPPEEERPRPGPAEVEQLRAWIAAGAPDFAAAVPQREPVSQARVLELIRRDLADQEAPDRRLIRYLTIAHLYNAGLADDELQTYRHGLSKLVNSLSWGPRIVPPRAIDERQTIFRINLRDYRWDKATWDQIVAAYPFGVTYATPEARACYAATNCRVPFVRADWFVAAASRPPLYHDLLRLPRTDRELEARLPLDRTADVLRAGFGKSDVALHNRLLERHDTANGGYYWKSYDFRSGAGRHNLFEHPLGPGPDPNQFEHAGGEILFSLPNGLQGYLLVDADGRRINQGPVEIVRDPKRRDPKVVNGISCMTCHVRGLIPKADEIREAVLRSPAGFTAGELRQIRALYPAGSKFADLLNEDAERFARAVKRTGAPASSTDPIAALATRYDENVDLGRAVAEADVGPDELRRALAESPRLARTFGPLLVDGGTVERQVLEENFADLVRALHRGAVHRPGGSEEIVNSIGMRLKHIPNGTFRMGSPRPEDGRSEEEHQHEVTITRPFYMGVFEVTQEEYEQVMHKNPSHFAATGARPDRVKGLDTRRFPVDSVSWDEARRFCELLSERDEEKRQGRVYRLPTEAEWEYACRGGDPAALPFHVGSSLSSDQANFDGSQPYGDEAARGPNLGRTAEVGSYPEPNGFGLYDMHGNVAEWCADWYDKEYYTASPPPHVDPTGPVLTGPKLRVLRGGSWQGPADLCRSAARASSTPSSTFSEYGFRVICTVPDKAP